MILKKGEMWTVFGHTDLWLFSANASVNAKGQAVMDRGLAERVKFEFPQVSTELGQFLMKQQRKAQFMPVLYGIHKIYVPADPDHDTYPNHYQWVGAFQVKYHYDIKAKLSLVGYSTAMLIREIERQGLGSVNMNFPGIGNGRLKREEVLPIISELPDCVTVWELS